MADDKNPTPDSPMKSDYSHIPVQTSKPPQGCNMAFAWSPTPIPEYVPFLAEYEKIRDVFLFNPDGKEELCDGLAKGPHAIFVGLKRDMDGFRQYVEANKGKNFKSPTHENLFRWNAQSIKKRLLELVHAYVGNHEYWENMLEAVKF